MKSKVKFLFQNASQIYICIYDKNKNKKLKRLGFRLNATQSAKKQLILIQHTEKFLSDDLLFQYFSKKKLYKINFL